jgi:hypothetical protein
MTLKFRKKPIEIEAVQLCRHSSDGDLFFDIDDLPGWLDAAIELGFVKMHDDHVLVRISGVDDANVSIVFFQGDQDPIKYFTMKTSEGTLRVDPGDWIVRDINGELHPCKPDTFAATYDAAA